MTRMDFELIAKTLRDAARGAPAEFEYRQLAFRFADALSSTNPLFDRQRFLDACK